MHVPRATWRTNGLVTLLAVVGLVFGAAGPATAATVGAGAGTGWEYATPSTNCGLPTTGAFFVTGTTFLFSHEATYDVVDPAGITIASYVGPVETEIIVGSFIAAPQGAVSASGCPALPLEPAIPGPVPIVDVNISGSSSDFLATETDPGEVRCDLDNNAAVAGFYLRVNNEVVFQYTVNCSVIEGNLIPGDAQDEVVTHVMEGIQNPCNIPVEPTGIVLGNPVFVTNPECAAIQDPRPGEEATSHLVTAFEAAGV